MKSHTYTWVILSNEQLFRTSLSGTSTAADLLVRVSHTSLAAASCNVSQAILASFCSSSSSHKHLVSSPALAPSQAGGLAFRHRAVCLKLLLAPLRAALAGTATSTRRSTQRLGTSSIASAPAVISTFGRDLFRIPDRSLTAFEMTESVVSIIPLSWTSQNGSFELASAALRGGFILCRDRSRPVRIITAATELILQPKQLRNSPPWIRRG